MPIQPPTVTPPDLDVWQCAFNGWTFGAGTPWAITHMTGLDLAQIRSGDKARALDEGQLIGLDLFGGRDIMIDLWVYSDGVSLQSALRTMAAATPVGLQVEVPFYIQLPDTPLLTCQARARKRSIPVDLNYGAAMVATPSLQLHATDPRFYAAPTTSSTTGLQPGGATGATFPLTFPVDFGGGTGPGELFLVNTGNFELRPLLVINGPVTNPAVTNGSLAGSPTVQFVNPAQSGYTLNSGESLLIDTDLQSVVLSTAPDTPTSPVADWLVAGSTWWDMPPGTNAITFSSDDSSQVAGNLEVWWAPTYVSAT